VAQISSYFEDKHQFKLAGRFMLFAGNYTKAVKLFFKASKTDSSAIDFAVDAIGLAKNDMLTHEVINFLMGDVDGIPKDARYIFKLYMSLGQFKEAARTAIIIAKEEQNLGSIYTTTLDNL
jgi:WD repeat-containing protein 19